MYHTRFEYTHTRLSPAQEDYIRELWPYLAACGWAYYLDTGQLPLIGVDETQLGQPGASGVCSAEEARAMLERSNPGLDIGPKLDAYRIEQELLVMFYRGNVATEVAMFNCPQLPPPRAYYLWEAFTHEQIIH